MHLTLQLLRQEHPAVAQDELRSLCQLLGQGPSPRQQLLSWQDLMHGAEFLRLSGRERLAGREKVAAAVQAHEEAVDDVHAIARDQPIGDVG